VRCCSGGNPFCHSTGLLIPGIQDSNPCNSHGLCYGAAQCYCDIGYGPESKQSGELLCATEWTEECTVSQITRATSADLCASTCCHGRGECESASGKCVSCAGEFTGERCEIDPCQANPCGHGDCATVGFNHSCTCHLGWDGDACERAQGCDDDPCGSHKKAQGGCTATGAEHTCSCKAGWQGTKSCDQPTGCLTSPCKHGGTCTPDGGEYSCECADGWSGESCSDDTGCDKDPCGSHGQKCTAHDGGGHTCTCKTGWSGTDCDHPTGCDGNPCGSHGKCTAAGGGHSCACDNGFSGDSCDQETGCDGSPCKHGGTCTANGAHHSCECASGWGGSKCAKDLRGFDKVATHIAGADAAGLAFVESTLPPASQKAEWRLCFDSRSDCTTCPSSASDSHCDTGCAAGTTSFHGGCDARAETLVLGHNSLGYCFGGYAMRSWAGSGWDTTATGDFLFRLGPGDAAAYRPTGGSEAVANKYQDRAPSYWPNWGHGRDLSFGLAGPLGHGHATKGSHALCDQGTTYKGAPNAACGGDDNWGATEMEVWYRVAA
jgi:hypothetical protein